MANYDGDIQLRVDLTPGDIVSTANEMRETVERVFKRSSLSGNLTTSFKSLLASMDKAYVKSGDLLKRLDELQTKTVSTDAYKALEAQMDSLKTHQQELLQEQKALLNKPNLSHVEAQLWARKWDEASQAIKNTESAMAELEARGKASIAYLDTAVGQADYERTVNSLKAVNDQLTVYTQRAHESQQLAPDPDPAPWDNYSSAVSNSGSAVSETSKLLQSMSYNLGRVTGLLLKMVGSGIIGGVKKLGSSFSKILGVMKNLGSATLKFASALAKTNKRTKSSNDLFKKGFRTFLRYGLGIRSVYFLFRRLRKALGEGIGNLAQYSAPFNTVISNFISALTRLKNTFATAFAPIINVVLPILTAFINAMSEAVTKIGMFIAALTGQKTFIRAKAVQEDYAASLDKTAGATNDANEAAKDYQKTISGFDDVEILKNPNADSGSGGSGGGGGSGGEISPQDMFETVELPAGFYDLAQMIKDAWKDADFTDVGELLGTKLAEALNNIPWEKIQTLADKFGKSFATFINGLLSVQELAKAVGTTIGEAINTLFILANGFVSNLEWEKIGQFFADVMNQAIATIKWNLIATTLATAANGVFNAIKTWAGQFNFTALGTEIKGAIETLLNGLKWEDIKSAFENLGSGLANFINAALSPNNENTGDGINADGIATAIGKTIGQAINSVFSGTNSFITGLNWNNIGTFFANVMNAGIATIQWRTIADTLANAANGIFNAANTWSGKFDFTALGNAIETFATRTLDGIHWEDAKSAASNLGAGLATVINNAITPESLGSLGTAIAETVNIAINGSHSFVTTLEWDNLGSSIASSINNFFDTVDWEKMGVTFTTAVSGLATLLCTTIRDTKWDDVGRSFGTFISSALKGFDPTQAQDLITEFQTAIAKFLRGLFDGIEWSVVFDKVIDVDVVAAKFALSLTNPLANPVLQKFGSELLQNLFGDGKQQETDEKTLEEIATWVKVNIIDRIFEAIDTILSGQPMYELAKSIWNLLGIGPDNNIEATVTVDAKETPNYQNTFQKWGGWIDETVTKTTEGKKGTIWDTAKSWWDNFTKGSDKKDNSNAIKIISGKEDDKKSFTGVQGTFNNFKSDTATKYLAGSEKDNKGNKTFKSTKEIFDEFTSNTATKYLSGSEKNKKGNKTFKATKKKFDKFKSNTATKYLSGSQKDSSGKTTFSDTRSAFNGVKDNTVKLILSGAKKDSFMTAVNAMLDVVNKSWQSAKDLGKKLTTVAIGGAFYNGNWHKIAQYATGGLPSHGTHFVAGENGAEVVGHINGRTEVLNQSQLAAVMYSSIVAGMSPVIGHITVCTNAIIATIGSALSYLNLMTLQIQELNTVTLPNIVTGKIVPSMSVSSDVKEIKDTLSRMNSAFDSYQNNVVTKDELADVLVTMFTKYMNLHFYVGDEDLARHVNRGNAKMDLRLNPVKG